MKKSSKLFEKLAKYEVMDLHRIYGGETAGQASTFVGGGGDLPDMSDHPEQTGFRADVTQTLPGDDTSKDPIRLH